MSAGWRKIRSAASGGCGSPLPGKLRFVPPKVLRPQPDLRKGDDLLPPVSGRVWMLPHKLPADPGVGEERSHIYAQVDGAKFPEEPLRLRELRLNPVADHAELSE